jgi:cytoskeletal protein CcmA (bactofilin family)
VTGEVQTARLAIEDGATLRGKVEAGKQPAKLVENQASAAASAGKSSGSISLNSESAAD